jgi:biotin carboxyl carrier protein
MTLAALGFGCPQAAHGQTPYQTQAGEMLLCKSAAASRVLEKVRSGTQGVMFAVFVKPGDAVRKGQLLGHTELDATKLQLDLAKHTMISKANVEAAEGQAEAWKVAREETEEAVRRRKMEESRLDWAIAMEKFHRGNYEVQLDAETTQEIQFEYWKDQYEKRFFRAPLDGVVSEVLVDVGKPVTFATHVFTVSNDSTYALPVTVPAQIAEAAVPDQTLPVRSSDGKSVSRAKVDSVTDDPGTAGAKIIKLLVKAADFPATIRPKLKGMKFDVLLPVASRDSGEQAGTFR